MTPQSDMVGPYELLKPLGEGGMAETFVAVRRGPADFERRVCLKRILPERAAHPMFVELFLDEARLLGKMQCRNIVQVYDFGSADGTYYMALELVDGLDLAKLLSALRERGKRMSLALSLHVLAEVLSALSYAHALMIADEPQGIVHRDISPSNILISRHGEVKLTDFGIAKARGRIHHTQTGYVKGKVAYMSPEQIHAREVDGRSDLFSLGIVLFELLTGVHPFDGGTDFAIQLCILAGKRPTLATLRPDLPAPVLTLIDRLLATDPDQRPASAHDALALLPPAASSFALQKQLAQLVDMRHEGTTEDAVALPRVSSTLPSSGEWAAAMQSLPAPLAAPVSAQLPAAIVEPSAGRSARRFVLAPLLVLAACAAYAWLHHHASGPPALPVLTASPSDLRARTADREPARVGSAGDRQGPSSQAGPGAPLPKVEEIISPAKDGVRAPAQPVEHVVSPTKGGARPVAQPTDVVVSPPKSAGAHRAQSVEAVISPPKGAQ